MSLCWVSNFLIVMLSVVMLSVVMLNVIVLSVVAPFTIAYSTKRPPILDLEENNLKWSLLPYGIGYSPKQAPSLALEMKPGVNFTNILPIYHIQILLGIANVLCYSGVNITNILRAAFSYESFLCRFYVLTIWVCNFLAKGFWHKSFS